MSDAAHWSRVRDLFSRALDLEPPLRADFLREACGGDSGLHAEVSSLLAAHADAGSIAEGSPLAALDASAVQSLMHGLHAGDRLGPYDVVGPLGAGGMGQVYEARDTVLGRRVAIKVLSAELALDGSARDRLVREAKALASLNHPNIAQIHGLETSNGVNALVMELIDGEDLSRRIQRGPIRIDEALAIARQIAGALAAAHEKGIVHRDLKPANIKVTPAGVVKVLDFGLAKRIVDADQAANTATEMVTHHGAVVGTPAYMSPEQVRGQDVDARTDTWAFGCVLYEMLAGRRAFDGSTGSDRMSAVLEREPDWSRLPLVSGEIRALLGRCLQKDRTRRLRDMGDVRLMLEDSPAAAAVVDTRTEPRRSPFLLALVALVAAAMGGISAWVARPGTVGPAPIPMRVEIVPSASDPINVATTTSTLAISLDGTRLAWSSASDRETSSGGPLVIRDLGELMPRRVEGAPKVRAPSFSPDGQWVLYYSGGPGLYKIPTAGGTRTTILPTTDTVRGTSWAEDDTIVYATTNPKTGLIRVGAGGGTPTVLTTPNPSQGEADHVLPSILPNGRGILFTILDADADNPRVAVLDTRNQSQKVLIPGAASAHYIDAGYLVYAVSGTIFGVRFDIDSLQIQGEPVTLATDVLTASAVGAYYAVSRTGTLAYVPGSATPIVPRTLVWVDRKGVETPLGTPPRAYRQPRLAPDGRRVAVAISDQQHDIWTWDLKLQLLTRISSDPGVDRMPIWSPDGTHLVFSRRAGAGSNLYRQSADGTGVAERLTDGVQTFVPGSITADGAHLIGNSSIPSPWTLFTLPLTQREPAVPLQISTPASRGFARLSPNNRFVAYGSTEGGGNEVFVRPYPDVNGGRWQVSTAGGVNVVWARGGRELFYVDPENRLTAVDVDTTGPAFRVGAPVKLFSAALLGTDEGGNYDVSPDGTRFLIVKEDPASRPPNTPIVLVTNVVELLRARSSTR